MVRLSTYRQKTAGHGIYIRDRLIYEYSCELRNRRVPEGWSVNGQTPVRFGIISDKRVFEVLPYKTASGIGARRKQSESDEYGISGAGVCSRENGIFSGYIGYLIIVWSHVFDPPFLRVVLIKLFYSSCMQKSRVFNIFFYLC